MLIDHADGKMLITFFIYDFTVFLLILFVFFFFFWNVSVVVETVGNLYAHFFSSLLWLGVRYGV